MGVSLSYTSTSAVSPDQRSGILGEADDVNKSWQWWCESINFFDNPHNPDGLSGDTKLFRRGFTTDDGGYVQIDPAHDTLMALRDARAIIDNLRLWSKKYSVSWRLVIEGQGAGTITNGRSDSEVEQFLDGMQEMAVALGADEVSDPAIEAIVQQYSSGHDTVSSSLSDGAANLEQPQETKGTKRKWWKFWG